MKLGPYTMVHDQLLKQMNQKLDDAGDLLEDAWGIIANAHNGNWETASTQWVEAAVRFRESYFGTRPVGSPEIEAPNAGN